MGHVVIESQPWIAPKTLNPIPKPTKEQHLVATHKRKPSSPAISLPLLAFSEQNTSWVVLQERLGENADGFRWGLDDIGASMVQTEDGLRWGCGEDGFERGKGIIRGD